MLHLLLGASALRLTTRQTASLTHHCLADLRKPSPKITQLQLKPAQPPDGSNVQACLVHQQGLQTQTWALTSGLACSHVLCRYGHPISDGSQAAASQHFIGAPSTLTRLDCQAAGD